MTDPFDRMGALARDSAVPSDRIRFFDAADGSIVQEISCGILFVMAFWSGPSRVAFRKLTEVLASLDPDERLEFVVVDTDGCPELYDQAEFIGRMRGAGETAWVSKGKILFTSGLGYNPKCFAPRTASLLSICSARPVA